MKIHTLCLLGLAGWLTAAAAAPLDVIGDDDASKTEYGSSGWADGKSDGTGFGKWVLRTSTESGSEHSHAGFYIAGKEKGDLNGVAIRDKAFAMYANGTGFEEAAAFRTFDKPLKVGQSFSWLMEHGEFVKKFAKDADGGGSIGVTLRAGDANANAEDYNKGVRFEIGYYQADKKYVIYDGDGKKALDVPFTDAGLAVTFTLVTMDTYDLEITTLADKKTVKLSGRKLGGEPGVALASFCLFDRNGETNDAYFNGFQLLQEPEG